MAAKREYGGLLQELLDLTRDDTHVRQEINEGLALIFQGIARLRDAFPNRAFTIDGRLVGDIGEVIAGLEYDIELDTISRPGYDACTRNGRLVQIKAR